MTRPSPLATPAPPFVHLAVSPGGALSGPAVPPGTLVRRIDGRRALAKPALLRELARAFGLPETFGANWDALEDSLSDLGELTAPGYLLAIEHADRLLAGKPAEYRTLLAILEAVGRWWATPQDGPAARPARPFHTVLAVAPDRLRVRRSWRAAPLEPASGAEAPRPAP